jgi:hypothetical protein
MLRCSCLCRQIKFEFEDVPGQVFNCHCSVCRKSHGAAFSTQAVGKRSSLKFLQGKELLKEYHTPGGVRAFCPNCGSRLMNYARGRSDLMSVALAAIDGEYSGVPIAHVYVGSKAKWHEPSKDIPGYDELPGQ